MQVNGLDLKLRPEVLARDLSLKQMGQCCVQQHVAMHHHCPVRWKNEKFRRKSDT